MAELHKGPSWLLVAVLLSAAGCSQEPSLILDWLELGYQIETEVTGAPPELLDPWSRGLRPSIETARDGREFLWSRGAESRFSLNALRTKHRTLVLDGFPAPSRDGSPQTVDVHVGDVWLGQLTWTAPARRDIEIPADVLKVGRNEVLLRYGYTVRPSDLRPPSGDSRDLAMAWHRVGLEADLKAVWWRPVPTPSVWHGEGIAKEDAKVVWWIDRGRGEWTELGRRSFLRGPVDATVEVPGEPGTVARLGVSVISGRVDWTRLETEISEPKVERRPIVLVTLDTTRRDALSCYTDGPQTKTLDRLAAEGTVWDAAFCPTPSTAPTHASLFLARIPAEHGLKTNGRPLPRADGGHAAVQAQAWGYETAAFISLGVLQRDLGFTQGFHHFDGDLPQGWWRFASEVNAAALPHIDRLRQKDDERPGFLWVHYSDPHKPYGLFEEPGQRVVVELNGTVLDTLNTMGLERQWFVELRGGENELRFRSVQSFEDTREHWFVCRKAKADGASTDFVSGWTDVRGHQRMRADARLVLRSASGGSSMLRLNLEDLPTADEARRRYGQEVTAVDEALGELLEHLGSVGWLDRGLVMIVGDHGEDLGENGHFGHVEHVGPTLSRVPMILWSRDMTPTRYAHPVSVIDVMPTLWDMVGIPPPPSWKGHDARKDIGRVVRLETFPPEAQVPWRGVVWGEERMAATLDDVEFLDLDGSPLREEPAQALVDAWVNWPTGTAIEAPRPEMQERLKALGYAN